MLDKIYQTYFLMKYHMKLFNIEGDHETLAIFLED